MAERGIRVDHTSVFRWVFKYVPQLEKRFRENKKPEPSAPAQAATLDVASQLEKLAGLKEKGLLTQEEFDSQKKKLLEM